MKLLVLQTTDNKAKKSLWFLVIGWLQNRCGDMFFFLMFFGHLYFLPIGKYVIHCIRGDHISHVQSMVAKRGLTNRENVHTPM